MYVTEIYCHNPECNVRQVRIRTKDYDQPDPKAWFCPACSKHTTTINWRRTGEEHEQHELRWAISRVNMALYTREMPDEGLPVDVMIFEELPSDWKSHRSMAKKSPHP
jgi:hypothetical protein